MFFFTEQEVAKMSDIGIIGGGPAGIMCAIFAAKNPNNKVFILDKNIILNTILPTGGGRCNLAYCEYNFKELAKFYPRGEKFLYSILSKFSTADTIEFFNNIGVETYVQEDLRVFPVSDSSKEVKNALLKQIDKKNIKKLFENVLKIKKTPQGFDVTTDKGFHHFDKLVIATGGKGNGHSLAKSLGHNVTELRPALSSLITKEKDFATISGISLKNIEAQVFFNNKKVKNLSGDFLFTHNGISGPLVYKISSYCAYLNFDDKNPLKIVLNLVNKESQDFDKELSEALKTNAQKDILNTVSNYIPKNLAAVILKKENISHDIKSGQLSKQFREKIVKNLTSLTFNAIKVTRGEEIVTAGGVDLKEIGSKTMGSKLVSDLYFCGEILDIDGLTGGFNLQNCWSTGYIAGKALCL